MVYAYSVGSGETTTWENWTTEKASTNSYTIWSVWTNDLDTCIGTSMSSSNVVWKIWTSGDANSGNVSFAPKELTEEEKQRQMQEREARRLAEEKRRADQAAADAKADELLLEFLDAMQRNQLEKERAFMVDSETGKKFRIRHGSHAKVEEFDENGKLIGTHCIYAPGVPAGDEALAKKLMLETNEAEFRKIANFTRINA